MTPERRATLAILRVRARLETDPDELANLLAQIKELEREAVHDEFDARMNEKVAPFNAFGVPVPDLRSLSMGTPNPKS